MGKLNYTTAKINEFFASFINKIIDTSSLTNDNDHIPTSGAVKSAIDVTGMAREFANTEIVTTESALKSITVSKIVPADIRTDTGDSYLIGQATVVAGTSSIFGVARTITLYSIYGRVYRNTLDRYGTWSGWDEVVTKSALAPVDVSASFSIESATSKNIYKAGNIVTLSVRLNSTTYSGSVILFNLPAGFIPQATAIGSVVKYSDGTPIGSVWATTNGRMTLYSNSFPFTDSIIIYLVYAVA